MRNPGRFPPWQAGGLIVLGLAGCGQSPLEANGSPSHTLSITVAGNSTSRSRRLGRAST